MSWQEYKPSDKVQARHDAFDKDTRNTYIMIVLVSFIISCGIGYSLYVDHIKNGTIITLSSQLEECQLKKPDK